MILEKCITSLGGNVNYDEIVEYLYDVLVEKNGCGLTMYGAYIQNGVWCKFNTSNSIKEKTCSLIIDNKIIIQEFNKVKEFNLYRQNCTLEIEQIGANFEYVENIEIRFGE